MAPCNEHPVECDEALSRHVTIRDNDTASACYNVTPGLSRSGPTLVMNKPEVTPSSTGGGRNLRRNKTINDNNLYNNNKVVPEPF